jgi:cell division protein FtsB
LRSQHAAEQREARATIAAYANHIQALSLRNAELEAENATLREALHRGGSVASLPVTPRMLPPE